ncbi:MAG TPA: uracil-DNA glycosylase, partial [Bacteroidales bacterium]|nr:uracil-DNA glycosylase [Bacteroidales bacterium]
LSNQKQGLVFLLWGKFAQGKEALIDISKHHILKAAHPSPLSAYNGFFGCRHFSKTNELLRMQGKKEIDWAIE